MMGPLTGFGMGANQVIHDQLGPIKLLTQGLIGKLQQIHILGVLRKEIPAGKYSFKLVVATASKVFETETTPIDVY